MGFLKRHWFILTLSIIFIPATALAFIFFPPAAIPLAVFTASAIGTYTIATLIIQFVSWLVSDRRAVNVMPAAPINVVPAPPIRDAQFVDRLFRDAPLPVRAEAVAAAVREARRAEAPIAAPAAAASNVSEISPAARAVLPEEQLSELLQDKTLTRLLGNLCEDTISFERITDPIMPNSLMIYDNTHDSYATLDGKDYMATFAGRPFPFSYTKFKELCTATSPEATMAALFNLAICPVTNTIMTRPMRVHMRCGTNDFVLVCDESALKSIPDGFQVVRSLVWADLEPILKQARPILERALPATAATRTSNWATAYEQAKTDFPTCKNPAFRPKAPRSLGVYGAEPAAVPAAVGAAAAAYNDGPN